MDFLGRPYYLPALEKLPPRPGTPEYGAMVDREYAEFMAKWHPGEKLATDKTDTRDG